MKNIQYSPNIDRFVVDTSRLHLTFVAFCLLSVIFKNNSLNSITSTSANQSSWPEFRAVITSSVWNFYCWGADDFPAKLPQRRGTRRRRLYSQASVNGFLVADLVWLTNQLKHPSAEWLFPRKMPNALSYIALYDLFSWLFY